MNKKLTIISLLIISIFSGCSNKIGSNLQPISQGSYIVEDEAPYEKIERLKKKTITKIDRGEPISKQRRKLKKSINKEIRETIAYSKELKRLEQKKIMQKKKKNRKKQKVIKVKKVEKKDNNTTEEVLNELKYF